MAIAKNSVQNQRYFYWIFSFIESILHFANKILKSIRSTIHWKFWIICYLNLTFAKIDIFCLFTSLI